MFIVIDKISQKYKEDHDGNKIKHPTSGDYLADGYKIVSETIRIDQIKSAREFHDPKRFANNGVEGDVTVLYMIGKKTDKKDPVINISENIDSFNKRIKAVETKG